MTSCFRWSGIDVDELRAQIAIERIRQFLLIEGYTYAQILDSTLNLSAEDGSNWAFALHPDDTVSYLHQNSELEDGWRVEWLGSRIDPDGLDCGEIKRLQTREARLSNVIEEVQEALDDTHLDISGVDFWELDSLASAVKVVVNLAIERDGYKLMVGEVEAALRGEYSAEWEGYIAGEVAQLKRLHWEQ